MCLPCSAHTTVEPLRRVCVRVLQVLAGLGALTTLSGAAAIGYVIFREQIETPPRSRSSEIEPPPYTRVVLKDEDGEAAASDDFLGGVASAFKGAAAQASAPHARAARCLVPMLMPMRVLMRVFVLLLRCAVELAGGGGGDGGGG